MQAMQTSDGRWRVEVGGVGTTPWYILFGPGLRRSFPTIESLAGCLAGIGLDLSDLTEAPGRVRT